MSELQKLIDVLKFIGAAFDVRLMAGHIAVMYNLPPPLRYEADQVVILPGSALFFDKREIYIGTGAVDISTRNGFFTDRIM